MNTNTKKRNFFRFLSNGRRHELMRSLVRIGDLVKIRDWGGIYDSYVNAFETFTGKSDKPYYCDYQNRNSIIGNKNKLFKVIDIAEHGTFDGEMLFYVIDNERRGAVMGSKYLIPHKVYPLRPGESYDTVTPIKRIKNISYERD